MNAIIVLSRQANHRGNKMKQPQEVILKFIKAIEEEKELMFNMGSFYSDTHSYNYTNSYNYTKPILVDRENICGTSACIAGTVAYRLAPDSTEHAEDIIVDWAGLWDNKEAINCLDTIFTVPDLYGEMWLEDVTQEQVLSVLHKLLVHTNWNDLYLDLMGEK